MHFLRYHWNVGLGRAILRWRRWRAARRPRLPRGWKLDRLAPPLRIGTWTKELVALHYLKGRYA
ncbi:MAG: hypothetical protein ACE5LD_04935, partial [Candidatus Bipolaricaulia bacterium]